MEKSLEEVLQFLREREVDEAIVQRFREEKIDGRAVKVLTDKELETLGLTAKGDLKTIRDHCGQLTVAGLPAPQPSTSTMPSGSSIRKKKLLAIIAGNKVPDGSFTRSAGRPKSVKRRVQMGLRVFQGVDDGKISAAVVKAPLGDNNYIIESVDVDCQYNQLRMLMTNSFFAEGTNPVIGPSSGYSFDVVNAHNKAINKEEVDISLHDYIKKKKIPGEIRLYLLCTPIEEISDESELQDTAEFPSMSKPKRQKKVLRKAPLSSGEWKDDGEDSDLPDLEECLKSNKAKQSEDSGIQLVESGSAANSTCIEVLPSTSAYASDDDGRAQEMAVEVADTRGESGTPTVTFQPNAASRQDEIDSIAEVMAILSSKVVKEGRKNLFNVDREEVLSGGFRAIERGSFDPFAEMDVKFSDEDGIDTGGPSREFMRLALKELRRLPIFGGPENSRMLVLDQNCKEKKVYFKAGKMLAYFFVQRGPYPLFMSSLMYEVLVRGLGNASPGFGDIVDYDVRDQVQKIEDSVDEKEFAQAVLKAEDLLSLAGCTNLATRMENKNDLLRSLLKFLVLDCISEPFKQFEEGMHTAGVLDLIRQAPNVCKAAFVQQGSFPQKLDAQTVENLFSVNISAQSGPKFRSEKRILTYWRDLLQDLEEGAIDSEGQTATLEGLLILASGADQIHFQDQPQLYFYHPEDVAHHYLKGLPKINSCDIIVHIPVTKDYDEFRDRMYACINRVTIFSDQ